MSIFSLNAADIANALQGGSPLSIINSVLHPSYGILDSSGEKILDVDFASITPRKYSNVTTAPVEGGKYQSIQKVESPGTIQCSVLISGLTGFSGNVPDIFSLSLTSQSDVLTKIKTMLSTAAVYDIETPKEILSSYDLTGKSYTVNSQSGVSLLTITLEFTEIIQQAGVVLSGTQSTSKITSNSLINTSTGVTSKAVDSGATTSTLDSLKSSWNNLKSATGQLAGTVSDNITQTFTSGLDTVGKSAGSLLTSASNKSADLIKEITASIT